MSPSDSGQLTPASLDDAQWEQFGFDNKKAAEDALIEAAQSGDSQLVQKLITDGGVFADIPDSYGMRPLSHAARCGYQDIVQFLLNLDDVDIGAKDFGNWTALLYAVMEGHTNIVEMLLTPKDVSFGAIDGGSGSDSLVKTTEQNSPHAAKLLSRRDGIIDVNAGNIHGDTPLLVAATYGYEHIVQVLLSCDDVEVNCRSREEETPLFIAGLRENLSVLNLLLERGDADVNARNHQGNTLLSAAVSKGLLSVVELLLNRDDLDLNTIDQNGRTPLIEAASSDDCKMVQLLLGCDKVDVNAKAKGGNTALYAAARHGHADTVQVLLGCGRVDAGAVDEYGETLLFNTSRRGDSAIVKLLLERDDIDPNMGNNDRDTPLSVAAEYGNEEVINVLLSHDKHRPANRHSVNAKGLTPLENAWTSEEGRKAAHLLCPACRQFAGDESNSGSASSANTPRTVDLGSTDFKVEFAPGAYPNHRCALYHLLRDMHLRWSGKESLVEEGRRTLKFEKQLETCTMSPVCILVEPDLAHLAARYPTGWVGNNTLGVVDGLAQFPVAWSSHEPLEPRSLARYRHWIDKCERDHALCKAEAGGWDDNPPMPTRVLDLGDNDGVTVRLLVTQKDQRGRYAALSHCWGPPTPFRTFANNLQERQKGFILDDTEVPATFTDAIRVTRALGIQYLWIDSLCIVQDDPDDLRREISRMCAVYRNAYLTIAASCASSDAESFLGGRQVHDDATMRELVHPSGNKTSIFLRKIDVHYTDEVFPLDTRGWTLQEAYLSRRMLRFLPNETAWVCQTCEREELRPDDDTELPAGLSSPLQGTKLTIQSLLAQEEHSGKAAIDYDKWSNLVHRYSRRRFTHEPDRLPALGGLAQALTERLTTKISKEQKEEGEDHDDDEYLAGLWKSDICRQLCWMSYHPSLKAPQSLIPSWSWVSVSAPVDYQDWGGDNSHRREYVSFAAPSVTIHGDLSGPDRFFQLKNDCHLEIHAPLLQVLSCKQEESFGSLWRLTINPAGIHFFGNIRLKAFMDTALLDKPDLSVLLLYEVVEKRLGIDYHTIQGLVVQEAVLDEGSITTYTNTPFQRVGWFRLYKTSCKEDFDYHCQTISLI